jgi:hypothetical protein
MTDPTSMDNRDNSVGIATGYGLDDLGSILSSFKILLFPTASRPAVESSQSPIHWAPGVMPSGLELNTPI